MNWFIPSNSEKLLYDRISIKLIETDGPTAESYNGHSEI